MTCQSDRLFPAGNKRRNTLNEDRCTEDRTVHDRTDRTVRALPHLLKLILIHTLCVWSDCGTLNCNAEFNGTVGSIDCYLIVSFITMRQSQIKILCLQIHKRFNDDILDLLPDDSCHFIAIHLNEWRFHLNFTHLILRIS